MSRSNPSHILALEVVDNIVDRLMKGKYEKRPPTNKELWQAGMMNASARVYVTARWPDLTRAGKTMRSNKLSKLLAEAFSRESFRVDDTNSDPDCVWRAYNRSYDRHLLAELHIVGPGKTQADLALLRQQVWLLYGWLWNGAIEGPDNLYLEKVGMGGQPEANIFNGRIINEVKDKIRTCDQTIEEYQAKKQLFVQRIEALETMALSAFANAEF
jgi:hypothetical protein